MKKRSGRPPIDPAGSYPEVISIRAPGRLVVRLEAIYRKLHGDLDYNQSAFVRQLLEETVSAKERQA